MRFRGIIELIDRQQWLEPVTEAVQGAIRGAYASAGAAGQPVKNFLHGTWLGHPLHAVLTDVPLGAWTAALAIDALEAEGDRAELAAAADVAITVGIAGAVASALAGFTDWEHVSGRPGKIGLVHATLNTTALVLYLASLSCRKGGRRPAGRALAFLGYSLTVTAAYLGGELVFSQQIGVDHADAAAGPEKFVGVLAEEDLPEGHMRRVEADGAAVLLVRKGGHIYAMSDTCAHQGCSLAKGKLAGDSIVCACHGSRYALEDGYVIDGPSTFDQPYFDARIRKGQIEVRAARGVLFGIPGRAYAGQ